MTSVWKAAEELVCSTQQASNNLNDPIFSGKLITIVDETRPIAERSSNCSCRSCISSSSPGDDVVGEGKRHLKNPSSSVSLLGYCGPPKTKPNTSQKGNSCCRAFERERPSKISKEINGSVVDEKLSSFVCQICGDQFDRLDALEARHVSMHAVTNLAEGDSSRNIVEKICQTGWTETAKECLKLIEGVLKVHNMQKFVTWFEEGREIVKIKANEEPTKTHPRCVADGNEVLRYYVTTVACSLGMNDTSGLYILNNCGSCRILRRGFGWLTNKHLRGGRVGTFVSSTGQRALEYCSENYQHGQSLRKALFVCRVVAGRVKRPIETLVEEEITGFGFDSIRDLEQ